MAVAEVDGRCFGSELYISRLGAAAPGPRFFTLELPHCKLQRGCGAHRDNMQCHRLTAKYRV